MMHAAAHSRGLQLVPDVLGVLRGGLALRPECEIARPEHDGVAGRVHLVQDAGPYLGVAGGARVYPCPLDLQLCINIGSFFES